MRYPFALAAVALVVAACGGETGPNTTATQPLSSTVAPSTTTSTTSPTSTSEPSPVAGTFPTFVQPPDNQNWLQASLRGGQSLAEEPELCLILDDGAVGQIHAVNFALDWSEDLWTLYWRTVDATYDGPVEGTVDGFTVVFDGEAGDIAVKGTVTCVEP